jgi:hypothetical protein
MEPKEKQHTKLESATVVGSTASFFAGAATALASTTAAMGLHTASWAIPVVGMGAFLVGGVGAFFLKDKILDRAEKDAKSIEAEGMPQPK